MDTETTPILDNPEHIEIVKRNAIRLVIADDHPIVRDGLKRLLLLEEDLEVVGEAADGQDVLNIVRELAPDVLLLDLRMPNLDGFGALQALQQMNNRTRVIVLTASEDVNQFVQAMKLGCSGIVPKLTAPELIVASIRKVHAGGIWLDSETTTAVMRQFSAGPESRGPAQGIDASSRGQGVEASSRRQGGPLSARERQIATLVAQGYKNKEIAEKIFISDQTVKNHLHNIFDKTGASDRLELALYVVHKGLHLEGENPVSTSPRIPKKLAQGTAPSTLIERLFKS